MWHKNACEVEKEKLFFLFYLIQLSAHMLHHLRSRKLERRNVWQHNFTKHSHAIISFSLSRSFFPFFSFIYFIIVFWKTNGAITVVPFQVIYPRCCVKFISNLPKIKLQPICGYTCDVSQSKETVVLCGCWPARLKGSLVFTIDGSINFLWVWSTVMWKRKFNPFQLWGFTYPKYSNLRWLTTHNLLHCVIICWWKTKQKRRSRVWKTPTGNKRVSSSHVLLINYN